MNEKFTKQPTDINVHIKQIVVEEQSLNDRMREKYGYSYEDVNNDKEAQEWHDEQMAMWNSDRG